MQIFSISKSAGNKKRLFETKAVHGSFYISLPRFFVTNLFSLRRKESKYFHAKRGKKKKKEGEGMTRMRPDFLSRSLSLFLPLFYFLVHTHTHTHKQCVLNIGDTHRSISFDLRERGKKNRTRLALKLCFRGLADFIHSLSLPPKMYLQNYRRRMKMMMQKKKDEKLRKYL